MHKQEPRDFHPWPIQSREMLWFCKWMEKRLFYKAVRFFVAVHNNKRELVKGEQIMDACPRLCRFVILFLAIHTHTRDLVFGGDLHAYGF